jgi:hypothetical protein
LGILTVLPDIADDAGIADINHEIKRDRSATIADIATRLDALKPIR